MTVSTEISLEDILNLLVQGAGLLLPEIASIVADWRAGNITAEEADTKASGQFSAMAAALADPHGDAKKTNDAVDAEVKDKFEAGK